jgi:hypothetical protein
VYGSAREKSLAMSMVPMAEMVEAKGERVPWMEMRRTLIHFHLFGHCFGSVRSVDSSQVYAKALVFGSPRSSRRRHTKIMHLLLRQLTSYLTN